ncbi:MAG: ribonuclease R [Deltaproteobacteria bacterium CG_4_8_14_3_um_filter_45_9]|nr:MAG: ribonuclease R [Deltaproteobacteria bacterium CG03_land_8_20_14_0_80_45_14]PIX24730.1 MAG: ribonuclease R [Deltaproteobacteria bacterium CG_4_8_14_3_um_filter_45_9]
MSAPFFIYRRYIQIGEFLIVNRDWGQRYTMGKKRIKPYKAKKVDRKERLSGISVQQLLELMKEEDRPLLLREILRRLGLEKEQRQKAREYLRDLVDEGKVVRIRGNRYGLPSKMNLIVGRVKAHPDGYGFVIPETEGEEDIFISSRNLKEAMHGDRVVARIESIRKKGKEGSVIRILERKTRKVVGKFMRAKNYSYIIPEDERILQEVFIPEGETKKARPNQIVVAEITQYPTERARPEGRITHILGYPDDPEVEPQIIIHKYDLPYRFTSAALKEAQNLPPASSSHETKGRIDLRGIPTFTIDGENARDFDDAVSIERERDGGVKLYVSISDVSHYVREETTLDNEAYLRGTSVYFPDRAIPMFPTELSNEICCLHPRVDRLTLTAELRYDENGERRGVQFYPSVIRSNERLTYTLVRKILVDGDSELKRKFKHLLPSLELMADLCQKLRRRRTERGAIDFDLPEPEVILNLQGEAEDIIRAERNLAHQIIEEFMIAANEAVAHFMEEKGFPFIYRIHEPPKKEAIDEFRRFISHLGYKMKKDSDHSPKEFQRVLSDIRGRPEERVVNQILLRSMKWAKYSAKNLGHFGLASDGYTHFTSPIRRYPDLIVHRLLKRVLSEKDVKIPEEVLANKAEYLSERERVAMEAEREILNRYRVRFMKDKTGEEFEGIISGVAAFGFFVELKDIFVDGLVRMTSLHDDYYQYHEKRYCLVGERTHKTFRIGDEVRVRVDRVDVERRHIDFGLIQKK